MKSKQPKVQSLQSSVSPQRSTVCSLQSAVSPPRRQAAFTLIELLVAMGLLMIIVLMLSNIFQMSTRTWDAGLRQADIGLEARAAINIIQQDLLRAVPTGGAAFDPYSFKIYARTNNAVTETVTYTGGSGNFSRNGIQILGSSLKSFNLDPLYPDPANKVGLPDLVEIAMTLDTSREYSEVRVFVQGRGHHQESDPLKVIDTHRSN